VTAADPGSSHADDSLFQLSTIGRHTTMSQVPDPSMAPEVAGGSGSSGRQRLRAMRAEVQIIHQAMAVALPTNQQIGPWQRQAARLLALAEKQRVTGADTSDVANEAVALLREIDTHRKSLLRDVSRLPDKVAENSRLEDTERALQSVAAVLIKALGVLGVDTPRG
jgi:hypothetical protein